MVAVKTSCEFKFLEGTCKDGMCIPNKTQKCCMDCTTPCVHRCESWTYVYAIEHQPVKVA